MEHNQEVQEFLKKAKADDPDRFKEVCDKYPVLTAKKWKAIRQREITVGLNVEDQLYGKEQDD